MLQTGSFLLSSDNSGAKKVECIKILGKHAKSPGFLGDLVIVSVKSLRSKGNLRVKKKDICFAVVFKIKYKTLRADRMFFKFQKNTVILLNKFFKPYGTRFFGPIPKELREQKKLKMGLLGKDFV